MRLVQVPFQSFCSSWWVPRRWWRSPPRHWLSPECSRPHCQEGSQGTQPSFSSLRHGSRRGACPSLLERTHSTFWAFRASPEARPGARPAGRHPGVETRGEEEAGKTDHPYWGPWGRRGWLAQGASGVIIYTKGSREFKESQKKKRNWELKTTELGYTYEQLSRWYTSTRTRVGKLLQTISRQEVDQSKTDRDKFLVKTFTFLKSNIVRQHARVARSVSIWL